MLSKLHNRIRQLRITYKMKKRLRKVNIADHLRALYNKPLFQSMVWVFSIFCLGFYLYYGNMQMKNDLETKNNQDLVLITSYYADSFLTRIYSTLQPIAALDTVRAMSNEEDVSRILQSVYLNANMITNLYAFDDEGRVMGVVHSNQTSPTIPTRDSSQHVILSDQIVISGRHASFLTPDSVFTVQVPVKYGVTVVGAVAADINMDKLREQMNQVALRIPYHDADAMEMLLFDGNGQLLYHNQNAVQQIEKNVDFSHSDLYRYYRQSDGLSTLTMNSPWDGERKLYSFAKIPNTDWGMMIASPAPLISNFFYKYLWRDTLVLFLFLLFTGMLHHSLKKTISREEILRRQTSMDPKTLLYNLKYFTEKAQEKMNTASEHGWPIGFILIDIDFFKHYNDTQGHLKGDYVLQEFSAILRKSIRDRDVTARYGGEEFVILLEKTGLEGTYAIADRIRQNVESWNFDGGEQQPNGRLTASFGVACYPIHGTQVLDLIEKSDIALYAAKSNGRNCVVIYDGK